jgi:dipeptidyl aminopeptidase/acylaminoacyl peptidase
VLKVESDELVAAARKNGCARRVRDLPDEGHGFLKKGNRITSASKILEFLDNYLKNAKAAPTSGQ